MEPEGLTLHQLEIPMQRPFATASGRVVTRSLLLVRIGPEPFGWGEAAPYPGQDEPFSEVLAASARGEWTPTLSAAHDEAVADREARLKGISLAGTIGASSERVPVSLAVGLDDADAIVDAATAEGVSHFKLKVAPGCLDQVARIRERHVDVVLGVDANGSFDEESLSELGTLADLDIRYLEQPTSDLGSRDLASIRSMIDAPVFADESVRSVADAERVLARVDGVVVKPGRLGWNGALEVRRIANDAGKLWRASGLVESGIGRAYTDILAACPDAFLSDVAPAEWFLKSGIAPSRFVNGYIEPPVGPGLGVTPSLPEPLDPSGVPQRYILG